MAGLDGFEMELKEVKLSSVRDSFASVLIIEISRKHALRMNFLFLF